MVKPAKDLLVNPEGFFQNLKSNEINWVFPLTVYFIYIIFNSLFLNYKPLDFPNELAVLNITNPSFLFYFGVQFFWGTFISLIFVIFATFLIKFYAVKLPIALFSCLFSSLAFFYVLKNADNFLFLGALLLIFTTLSVLIIKKSANNFIFILKASFSIHLILFLFLPMVFLSVFLKFENLFLIAELIMAVWLLVLFVKTVKTISAVSVLKIILIFGFSSFGTLGLFYMLVKMNLLSKNIFKVILSM